MDGCNRDNTARDVCTLCDSENSRCIMSKCLQICVCRLLFSLSCEARKKISQNSRCMPLRLPGGQRRPRYVPSSLAVLRCDSAGSASCFIDSYLPNTFTRSATKPACFGGWSPCGKSSPQTTVCFVFSQPTEVNKPGIQEKSCVSTAAVN